MSSEDFVLWVLILFGAVSVGEVEAAQFRDMGCLGLSPAQCQPGRREASRLIHTATAKNLDFARVTESVGVPEFGPQLPEGFRLWVGDPGRPEQDSNAKPVDPGERLVELLKEVVREKERRR